MAADLLFGVSEEDRLTQLRKLQNDLMRGKTLIGSGGGEVSASMAVQNTIKASIRMIQQSLYQDYPEKYPQWCFAGHRQTTAYFAS